MRVLHFINSLSSGGAEVFVTDLLLSINKNPDTEKVALIIYAGVLDERGESLELLLKTNGIEVFNLAIKDNYKKILVPFKVQRIIRNYKPHIFHSHLDQADLFTYLASKIPFGNKGVIFARTLHTNNLIKRIPFYLHKKVFKFFDLNCSCSKSVKEAFEIKIFRSEIIPVYNGVDLRRIIIPDFLKIETKNGIRLKLCVIGSFNKRHGELGKGQDILIKAIESFNNEVEVDFLGDGTEKKMMKELCTEIGINKFCRFHGNVNDIRALVDKADFIVFPSRFEGLPIAAIEAVVNGKPLIVSNIPAFDVFEKNSTIIFKSEDVKDLKRAICLAIKKKNEYIGKAVENQKLYRTKFNIDETGSSYLKLYSSKLNSLSTIE